MEKFNFVEIYQYRVDLKISCTDHFVLDNIVDEIKKKFQKIVENGRLEHVSRARALKINTSRSAGMARP